MKIKSIKTLIICSVILGIAILLGMRLAGQINLSSDSPRTNIESKIDNKIFQVAKKYGTLKIGAQGALNDIMLKKIREKTYYFESQEELTLKKGREYLVKLMLDILKILNEDKVYRKYLFEYPFHTKNVCLSIFSKRGEARNRNLPNITVISFFLGYLRFKYLVKVNGEPQGLLDFREPDYEENKIKEGFRTALHHVKDSLSNEQFETAQSLGLLNGNLIDEEISADREYRNEIDSKELWILHYEKRLREGTISKEKFDTDLSQIKKSNSTQWEKDIVFPDEKAKALYQKKIEYLKGEKEWEN